MPAKPSTRTSKRAPLALTVQFGRGTRIAPMTPNRVKRIVQACVESGFTVTIRFAARQEARHLNQQFRRRRYVPNVLTFSYFPEPAADIVICTPVVREQARAQGKTFQQHLAHMLVHGMLHAQGYQHDTAAKAARMEAAERRILASFGVPDPYLGTQ